MSQPYIAQISIVAFNFPPRNWAFCNGQVLPINQNQALFSLIGTTYGGNGTTTFALPNFQGRSPMHAGNGFSLGNNGGEAAHTLTLSEMPSHNHFPVGDPNNTNTTNPQNGSWAAQTAKPYDPNLSQTMSPLAIANAGGSLPHNNMQPYLVLNFVIALVGVYPSRN